MRLTFLLLLLSTLAFAQSDTLTADSFPVYPPPSLLATIIIAGSKDSPRNLLSTVLWEETSPGTRRGYTLRFDPYGPFEEDAGDNPNRKSRYLQGQWSVDSTVTTITFAVDYFLGQSSVHRRYRRGQDFYLDYTVVTLTPDALELKDQLTGKTRTFVARPLAGPDAATRRAEKIQFGKKKGGLEIPKGW